MTAESSTDITRPVSSKVEFANQLRGIAAWLVVANHYLFVYWGSPDKVSHHTASTLVSPGRPWASTLQPPGFDLGAFGVALFFLISGFVIPFSLSAAKPLAFLVARAIRVYPTYVMALAVQCWIVGMSAAYWGNPFPFSVWQILANASLLHGEIGFPSLDLVNWTLAVELKFYLVAAILSPTLSAGKPWAGLMVGMLAAVGNVIIVKGWIDNPFVREATFGLQISTFMLIGTLFFLHYKNMIARKSLVIYGMLTIIVFAGNWSFGFLRADSNLALVYVAATLTFASAYLLRRDSKPIRILDWAASTSYPMYLVHSLVGYVMLRFTIDGLGAHWSVGTIVAICVSAVIAQILHLVVEKPTIHAGKQIAQRMSTRN